MLVVVILSAFAASALGQTCGVGGDVGPCAPAAPQCQAGATCLAAAGTCCLDASIVQPATTTRATTTCFDLLNPMTGVSDCPSRAYLCQDSTYYTVMTQQCPRTCGRCPGTGTGGNTGGNTGGTKCVDLRNPQTGVSDCPSRAGYCQNSFYYALMTQQCPRTCGRCPTGK